MSEALEPKQKTNPEGDPTTSVSAPKAETKKDPHADAKRQKVVTPEYMFLEAPRTKEFITGSEAAKEAIRRSNVDLAIAYPITPQSETMQLVGVLYGEGYVKEYYRGEEEVGVMAAIAGGSRAGVRCYTATAGPGTLRGLEGIASWPGHRLPVVAMFTCRVVNAPLAIQPDNIEVSYLLNCGMIVFHAENQQDMYDFTLAGFIISEKNDVTLPVGVCCDGFFVTHARGYVRMQDRGMKLPPREPWRGAVPVLDAENPPARLSRDAPVQKSNFMAYNIHAVWQQEVWAAVERSRKYINQYMGGLLTAENVDVERRQDGGTRQCDPSRRQEVRGRHARGSVPERLHRNQASRDPVSTCEPRGGVVSDEDADIAIPGLGQRRDQAQTEGLGTSGSRLTQREHVHQHGVTLRGQDRHLPSGGVGSPGAEPSRRRASTAERSTTPTRRCRTPGPAHSTAPRK